MDPVTAAGLAVGIVSLAFDVFDGSVKLFKFLSFMVEMPKDCEQCRLRLIIEYNRLLAWGKAAGLIQNPEAKDLADSLGTDASELCAIISRIGRLLEEFKDINARWKNELIPHQQHGQDGSETKHLDILQGVSSLEVAYEKTKEERNHLRGTARIMRWMSKRVEDAKEIATHPYRVRWAMVDKEAFEELLNHLHALTERLHQLMGDYRQKRINDITAETYRELVLTRNDVNDLKDMLSAVTTLISNSIDGARPGSHDNYETFRDLLRLKEINRTADEILAKMEANSDVNVEEELKGLISVEKYDGATLKKCFSYTDTDDAVETSKLARARGNLMKNDVGIEAWIEWRYNKASTAGAGRDGASSLRVMALAQMLHSAKPKSLYAPNCIGYIDDVKSHGRYGWIFAMPEGSKKETSLRSLHSILGQAQYRPTLTQRITMAWKLASSLLQLHTADWLHKGIHSDNVVFAFDQDVYDAGSPILSGFDYSRPESNETTTRSLEPKWDIYRWPGIQGEAPKTKTSRKTYDIYSLGLVLLEIAHWKPLHRIIRLKKWPEPSTQDARIRDWLLGEEEYAPFDSNPLLKLRDIAGDRYWNAVRRCIVAHGENGLQVEEETKPARCNSVGVALQGAFNELVVKELKRVSV